MTVLCAAIVALRIANSANTGNIASMTMQNTKTKPASSFVRNIQAIWSDKRSVNTNTPRPNAHTLMTHKEHYAADRATD